MDVDAIPVKDPREGVNSFPSLSIMDPKKVSLEDVKIMERVNGIVREEDDVFEISDYLKLLRLHEKNLMLVLKEAEEGLTNGDYDQTDIEDLMNMLARVKVRKDEQEELEAEEYIDKHIIPNLPPGFEDGENN